MPDHISVTFLGTAAGKPSHTRNVSSLVVKLDSRLWVFDAGEGTQHQMMDPACKLAMGKVQKVFVTHMHADHINGLPGLLCTISAGEGSAFPGAEDPRIGEAKEVPPTQIYGPSGLRLFLRTCLSLTSSILSRPYVVHELLFLDEEPCPQDPQVLHPSEKKGRDIRMGQEGDWRDVVGEVEGDGVKVGAAPIEHTVRCIAYLLTESARPLPIQPSLYIPHLKNPINAAALSTKHGIKNPLTLLSKLQTERKDITLEDGTVLEPPGLDPNGGRRIAICGDTFDATDLFPAFSAAASSPAPSSSSTNNDVPANGDDYLDLLIHESTNAFLPTLDDSQSPLRPNPVSLTSITALARSHGHSTPQVAGAFAKRARARRLVMNHLSVKYPDPESKRLGEVKNEEEKERRAKWGEMLREIERQAVGEMVSAGEEAESGARTELGPEEKEGERWRVRTARDFMEVEVPRRDRLAGGGAEERGKKSKGKK
ncbi:hypothetical protein JCM11641_004761 [Rhodosporidiobolus odoratus]